MQELRLALRAELKQLLHDSGGFILLFITAAVSIIFSAFFSYVLVRYNPVGASPSANTACQGFFQAGIYGMMAWVVRHYLREVSNNFIKLKSLFMPNRLALWIAKLAVLLLFGVIFSIVTVSACTLCTLLFLELGGMDSTVMVGATQEYLALAGDTVVISIGSIAFSAGVAIFTYQQGLATAVAISWPLIFESLSNGDNPDTRWFHALLPFVNGLRHYQQSPASWFPWPSWASSTYFLLVTFGLFVVAVAIQIRSVRK